MRVMSLADLRASAMTLGTGGGLAGFAPVLTSTAPLLPSFFSLCVSAAPPQVPGLLVVAPAPESPFPLGPGDVLWPDLALVGSWSVLPFATSAAGTWSVTAALPASPSLAGSGAVLQAWFPSPLGFSGASASNGLRLGLGF